MDFARADALEAFLQLHVFKLARVCGVNSLHNLSARQLKEARKGSYAQDLTCALVHCMQEHNVAGGAVCVCKSGRFACNLVRTFGSVLDVFSQALS